MSTTFKEYLRIWLEIFLDNLCVYFGWLKHLPYLQMVFDHCRLYRISLSLVKCQFWVRHGVILGHVVSRIEISIDFNQIKLILELPPPMNFKGVQRFTRHTGYYSRFIYMYVELSSHQLYGLIKLHTYSRKTLWMSLGVIQ